MRCDGERPSRCGVHATRAYPRLGLHINGAKTHWQFEYATSKSALESGSGTVAASGISNPAEETNIFSGIEISTVVDHLSPATTYYLRVVADNEFGAAKPEQVEFTTLAVGAPEFLSQACGVGLTSVPSLPPSLDAGVPNMCFKPLHVTSAGLFAEIETDGAETKYHIEYSTSENGSYTPVAGAEGTVTVAEELARTKEAQLTGLTPGTTYYVRAVAENGHGSPATETVTFTTLPAHPTQTDVSEFTNLTATSAHLNGSLVPDESETHWRFEYAPAQTGPWLAVPGAEGTIPKAEADDESHNVSGDLTGLSPATTYYVRLFAENEHGEATDNFGEPVSTATHVHGFETAGPPTATAFPVHVLQPGGSLRLLGAVAPHGSDTHYRSEYVTQEQFEKEGGFAKASFTPALDLPADQPKEEGNITRFVTTASVGANLPGLQPGTTYHYRLAASNGAAPTGVHSAEQTLTVPSPAPETEAEEPCPNQALRGGASARLRDCRGYEQITPADKSSALDFFNNGGGLVTDTLVGQDGEHFMVSNVAVNWGSGPDAGQSPYFFSHTPGSGWQMTAGSPQREAGVDRYTPQAFSSDLTRLGLESGWRTGPGNESAEVEFKAGPPGGPYAKVASVPRPEVGEFGGWVAASAGAGKLILSLKDHTLLGKTPTGTASGFDLYEYSEGQVRQANIDSVGKTIGACGASVPATPKNGGTDYAGTEGQSGNAGSALNLAAQHFSAPHAVSADGSRVFFEAVPGGNCAEASHLYMRESGIGKTVDIGPYTLRAGDPEATQLLLEKTSGETQEFFLYETESASLTHLLTTQEGGNLGAFVHVSEDFRVIYLESHERLPGTEAPAGGGLYRYDVPTKALRYLMPSGPIDSISPDGRYVDLSSLAGAGVNGSAYRYDSAEGTVVCISCASPFNPEPKQKMGELVTSANGDYAFFITTAALVPQDINGEIEPVKADSCQCEREYSPSNDIYEWRADGIDGCLRVQGCIAMITAGIGDRVIRLLGTDASGRDVFFATHAQLVSQDNDTALDLYDARRGGGEPPPPPQPVECEGDACSTPFPAPSDLTPSSSTFKGAGNLLGITLPQTKSKAKPKAKRTCKAKAKKKCKATRKSKTRKKSKGAARHAKTTGRART